MNLSAAIARKARAFFEEVRDRPVPSESEVRLRVAEAEELAEKFKLRRAAKKVLPFLSRKDRKQKKRLTKNEKTSSIWQHCHERAAGICECGCEHTFDLTFLGRETLDHFDNGTGKSQRQDVKTCWMLRWGCHLARQALSPSIIDWNRKFRAHCERNEITPVFQHIEHAEVPRKSR